MKFHRPSLLDDHFEMFFFKNEGVVCRHSYVLKLVSLTVLGGGEGGGS